MLHTLLLLWSTTPAAAAESTADKALELVSGLETSPTAAAWAALGPDGEAALLAIAGDPARLPTQRGNALVALGYFPTERAARLLQATLADATAPVLLRRKACIGLAHGWGGGAVPELSRALAASDATLRISAARALGEIGDSSAKAALKARLGVEDSAAVRDVLSGEVAR